VATQWPRLPKTASEKVIQHDLLLSSQKVAASPAAWYELGKPKRDSPRRLQPTDIAICRRTRNAGSKSGQKRAKCVTR
jgi:hypothetical protein